MEPPNDAESRLKDLLERLGKAIGGSVSSSGEVDQALAKIRDHGYQVYVVLDARIAIDRDRRKAYEAAKNGPAWIPEKEPRRAAASIRARHVLSKTDAGGEFRMNIGDVSLLRALGIDGTRLGRSRKRAEPSRAPLDE